VSPIPTRWRTLLEDQLSDAEARTARAEDFLAQEEGGRALNEVYPAVVAAASSRVWLASPPWRTQIPPEEMQRRVRLEFPSLFAALAEQGLSQALRSPWRAVDAEPYVLEAREFVTQVRQEYEAWLTRA
jgi:hypothetical protein